ncbi:ecdysteroid 22-kinase family protein [Mycobacterium sp. Y57]|uniref:phosphotransferase n=1 Tax=Mycolicibacterium xanthum TaxID=2796469 RepID=UPI001C8531CC|nr:phosphotransferase [Mycolicibacterium xanthum]MBX7430591.1 ecdysteroid 22-kinase family protein [Mycolicibacterium xanthum]
MTSAGSLGDTTAAVPRTIDDVTREWLAAVLRADDTLPDDAVVGNVRAEQIALDSGFSSRLYRVQLSGNGIPPSVIVKLPAESEAGAAMRMLGGYAREVAFYRDVAGSAPLGTPHVFAARMAGDQGDFVLVLEDLQGWHNVDHLAGLSVEQARSCIDRLAGLHAWSTRHADKLGGFESFDSPFSRELLPAAFPAAWQVYRDLVPITIPPEVDAYAERFTELAPTAVAALGERSMLIHGDIRADNMFFAGGELKVVDFQLAAKGCGATDIGYLVSQGLPTEARSGRDEEFVRDYVCRLAEHGVADYPFDEAWRHYRFAVAYYIVLPALPLLGWDALPERSRQLCLRLLERAAAAIDEIGALEVFG